MDKIKGFAVLVTILSCLNLLNCFSAIHWSSCLISLVGISGSYLLFKEVGLGVLLLKIWMLSQTLIVFPIWDASQAFDLAFGYSSDTFSIKLNFIGFIYYFIFSKHFRAFLQGKSVQLLPLAADSHLAKYLPNTYLIQRSVVLGNDDTWYLVACEGPSDKPFALIRPKEGKKLNLKQSGQVICYRFVQNIKDLQDRNKEDDYLTGGYAMLMAS